MSHTLLILKIYTTFKDVQIKLKILLISLLVSDFRKSVWSVPSISVAVLGSTHLSKSGGVRAPPAPPRDDRPEMANPLLESFVEPQRICATNTSCPRQTLKEKETQICHRFVQTIGLLSWLSVCVLTIWYFRPFGNAGLQSPRDLPSP